MFTSEAIGFAFNSVFVFLWNFARGGFGQREGGYSAEWQKLGYEPKAYIIEQYKKAKKASNGGTREQKFEKQWESYGAAVFLSYLWQQYAPPQVETWVSRRHTAFFAGMSTAIAIGLAVVLSAIIIQTRDMGWTYTYICVSIASLILMAMIYANAQDARKEVWQTIDLWLAGNLNPRLGAILNNIPTGSKIPDEKRTVEFERREG